MKNWRSPRGLLDILLIYYQCTNHSILVRQHDQGASNLYWTGLKTEVSLKSLQFVNTIMKHVQVTASIQKWIPYNPQSMPPSNKRPSLHPRPYVGMLFHVLAISRLKMVKRYWKEKMSSLSPHSKNPWAFIGGFTVYHGVSFGFVLSCNPILYVVGNQHSSMFWQRVKLPLKTFPSAQLTQIKVSKLVMHHAKSSLMYMSRVYVIPK